MALIPLSQAERISLARTTHAYYLSDELAFNDYNAVRFSAAWTTDWSAAIAAAEALQSDENLVDIATDRTANLQQKMEDSRQNYQRHIKPFIEDAFAATAPGLMNAFGINDYNDARNTPTKMTLFLKNLADKCTMHAAALTAVGINPAKVSLITAHYNDLVTLSVKQHTFTGERAVSTEERVAMYAAMDEFTAQTMRAGKNIFEKEDPRYRRYVLYKPSAAAANSSINLTILANGQAKALQGAITAQTVLEVTNNGAVPLTLFITGSETDATATNAAIIQAGESAVRVFAADICPSGAYQFLLVRNEDATTNGSCTIDVMKVVEDNQ
jgi:hypothetical protein